MAVARPSVQGSTSSGLAPSTGGSVVSRSFQPNSSWSVNVFRVEAPGTYAAAPVERRQSGPPTTKNTATASTAVATAGQRRIVVTWATTSPSSSPTPPTSR